MRTHRLLFRLALTIVSRVLIVRDNLLDAFARGPHAAEHGVRVMRLVIDSAPSVLDAVYVEPENATAALLLCHGIGETVEHWMGVQQILARSGVASLVFDYSGYGKSTGAIHWEQLERDAVAAFGAMRNLAPQLPASVLGFSLGSGVAAAAMGRIPADSLILCEAFTSFRAAAQAAGVPKALAPLVPPIWDAEESLRGCTVPVLIVHGERDRLFPVAMARELEAICGERAELVLVPGMAHNQPFRRPEICYWGPIARWLGSGHSAQHG
jgi:hypothetical protein